MKLLVIGLPPSLESAIRAAAEHAGIDAAQIDAASALKNATKLFQTAVLVVIQDTAWGEWKRVRSAAPPVYVALSQDELIVEDVERDFAASAVGYGPASSPELAPDIVRCWQTLRRSDQSDVSLDLKIGSKVRKGASVSATTLIGWGMGKSAEARREISAATERLREFNVSVWPFDKAAPSEWLDLYAFHRLRLKVLSNEEAGDLMQRFSDAQKFTGVDDLCKQFDDAFVDQQAKLPLPLPVLVCGETGTGKSIVARMLHQALEKHHSRVCAFHHVNCSTLGDMAAVELFGGMRGAYTSLDFTNPGKVFSSFGGVLFLDEFGTLSPEAQAKLLLFLEDGTVTPMAWNGPALRVPVQIIAATNREPAGPGRNGPISPRSVLSFSRQHNCAPAPARQQESRPRVRRRLHFAGRAGESGAARPQGKQHHGIGAPETPRA